MTASSAGLTDADRSRPEALGDPRRRHRGAVDDRARRVHRHDRPAVGATRPRYLDGQPPVGDHRLHPGLRGLPAAGWPDRRLLGSQADVRRRVAGLRRRIGPRWPGRQRGHALRRPRPAGRVRGTDGTRRPVHPDHHLPARRQGAGQGVRRLRCRLGRRRSHRRPARGRAHRVRLVAVVPARQRADRRPRLHRGVPHRAREQGLGLHQVRRARARCSRRWAWSASSTASPRRRATVGAPRSPSCCWSSPWSS